VGTVLVVAFVVTPAAAARLVSGRIVPMMVFAAMFSAGCGWLGLVVSYDGSIHHGWRLASGATVVLTLTAGFVLIVLGRTLIHAVSRTRSSPATSTAVEPTSLTT
jgi:manganese/iron transport system permease protein